MRKKIWLVGSLNHFVQELEEELADSCSVQIAAADYVTLRQLIAVSSPELVLVYMNNMPWEKREELIRFLNESTSLQTHPLIVIGTEIDNEAFLKSIVRQQVLYLERPISASRVKKMILMRLKDEEIANANPSARTSNEMKMSAIPDISMPSYSMESVGLDFGDKPLMPEMSDGHRKKHILAVDDNIVLLRNIKSALEEEYRVTIAKTGVAALTIVGKDRPDLILLDYEMPLSDGRQILEMIRSDQATSNIPVFFLTGVTDAQKIKEVLALSPQGYILKSTGNQMIKKRLKEFFSG